MTKKLNDSAWVRWGTLGIVAFTMMAAYYVNDVMAPLKTMLEDSALDWNSSEFGFFTGAYSFLNVVLLMLIWGGLILDKFGIRFTGILSASLMVVGTTVEYIAITHLQNPERMIFGYKTSIMIASAGYSVFGVGAEVAGITVTKIIAKWFRGKEMATAMGVQVALARVGSQAAYAVAIPLALAFSIDTPLFIGLILLVGGLIAFLIFSVLDRKLDKQIESEGADDDDEKFSWKAVGEILVNPGFWLMALLCVLFYSCVFPFQKFATELMTTKYNISPNIAGAYAGLPALGALILTPLFGSIVDKKGKAATIMIIGAAMLIFVHLTYSLPFITSGYMAIILMIILGIAFSLVPSAMWPSVAKIFKPNQLGTAYALIFFIQNIGLFSVPLLIGTILDNYCIIGKVGKANTYDYTLPMIVFTGIAILSLFVAIALKIVDKKKGYNLEKPNIKSKKSEPAKVSD